MNVYVRALASALARAGVECDVYTRAEHPEQPDVVEVEPGFRVVHVEAGPRAPVAEARAARPRRPVRRRGALTVAGVATRRRAARQLLAVGRGRAPAEARARPAARRHVPHARTREGRRRSRRRSRAARARRARGRRVRRPDARVDRRRARRSSRRSTAPTPTASRSSRPASTTRVLARRPRRGAPRALGLDGRRVLLFVGRIQPLKGVDLAVRCLAELDDPDVPRSSSSAVRAAPTAKPSCARCTRSSRELGVERPRALRPAAAPRRARRLLPRRRRVPRAVAHRVVRARRARGRRVRHAGRRGRGRRPALARRRRPHRLPRRRPRPRRLRRADRDAARRRRARGRDGRAARPRVAPLLVEHRPPARLRRLYGDLAARGSCAATEPCDARDPLDEAFLAASTTLDRRASRRPVARGAVGADRRVRPGDPALVRALRMRRAATRRRSTSTCTSARCATRCTSCPTRPRTTKSCTGSCCSATTRCTARTSRSAPTATCYLVGRVLLEHLDVAELDRIIGVLYELVERWFQPAIRIGFGGDRDGPSASEILSECEEVSCSALSWRVLPCAHREARGAGGPAPFGEVRSRSEGSSGLVARPCARCVPARDRSRPAVGRGGG